MADGKDSGDNPAPPPASDKPEPKPKPSQFPRPTMDAIHGSLDPPKESDMLNLSQRRRPPKKS